MVAVLAATTLSGAAALPGTAAVGVSSRAPAPFPSAPLQDTLAADTVELAPIEVTVTRSPVRLDRMPFATSVLAGPETDGGSRSGLFIEEALHGLSGVRVQNRYNPAVGERISIRGFGARSQFGVRGVMVLIDGLPATLPDGQSTLDHLDVGNIGRVEALRGPAAALYGNGTGGVISFQSAAPFAGPYRQDVTAVVGSNGMARLQTTASGTSSGLTWRASVARHEFDGFRDNPNDSPPDPYSQATRTLVNGGVDGRVAGGTLAVRVIGLDLDALNAGSLPAELFDEGSNQAWGFNVRRGTRKYVRQGQLGVSWTGDAGSFSLYGTRRELDNPIPSAYIDLGRNAGGARAAFSGGWEASAGPARWDVGVEGLLQSDDRLNFANEDGARGELRLDQQESVRSGAVFGQLRLPLSTRLEVMGALRFDHFRFEADDRFVAADNPDDSGSRTMDGLSPSLGFHLDMDGHGLFASVARSLETPTTTELANQPDRAGGFNPDLEPQRGWTVEAGMRGDPHARFVYDFAAYTTRVTNQLIPFEVPTAPGRRFYRNAGRSRVRGIEAATRMALGPSVTTTLSYGYVDARFTEFAVGDEDYADHRVPGIAPHRLEASLRATAGRWFGELRMEARGDVPVNDANDASAESFTLLDLRLGGSGLRAGGLSISPFGGLTNLTDVRHASSVVVNAFGGRYFEPGPARGGYVGLSLAWEREG